jgi:SP family galactose:H+ symporter-like MFS transporter
MVELSDISMTSLVYTALVANLGSFLFGYDLGATSWLSSLLDEYADDDSVSYYAVISGDSNYLGALCAATMFGAVVTFFMLLIFGNHMSKKDELLMSSVLYFCGALIESMAVYASWLDNTGFIVLVVGRLIYGAGIATSFHSAPQYVAASGPAETRGVVGSSTEVMISCGLLTAYVVGYFNQSATGWTVNFRVAFMVAFLMGVLSLRLPHVPAYLCRNSASDEDILAAIRFIVPNAGPDAIIELRKSIEAEAKEKKVWMRKWKRATEKGTFYGIYIMPYLPDEMKAIIADNALRKCLYLGVTLAILAPMTGNIVLMYYANTLFDYMFPSIATQCVIGLGVVKLASALVMSVLGDSLERREFIIIGLGMMAVSYVCLMIGYAFGESYVEMVFAYISVVGYEISYGTMLWIVLNEIFPVFVASAANSIVVSFLFLLTATFTFITPLLLDDWGFVPVFILFTASTTVAAVVSYLYLPNTRGVSLDVSFKLVTEQYNESNRALRENLCCCICPKEVYEDDEEQVLIADDPRGNSGDDGSDAVSNESGSSPPPNGHSNGCQNGHNGNHQIGIAVVVDDPDKITM